MEILVEKIVAAVFLIIGVSHIVQPRVWSEFFIHFRNNGKAGVLQIGLLHLPLALLIVVLHNVWHGPAIVVTLIGWAQLLKAMIYLFWPAAGLRMLGTVSIENSWRFVVAGVFSILLGAAILLWLW